MKCRTEKDNKTVRVFLQKVISSLVFYINLVKYPDSGSSEDFLKTLARNECRKQTVNHIMSICKLQRK
jgi:hypothetical protein